MFSQNTATGTRSKLAAPAALLLILVTLIVLASDRMNALESVFYDFLQKQNAAQASNRIILVDISSAEEAEEFWNIERFKPVIDRLNAAGAALIVPIDSPPANVNLPDIDQLTALAELEKRTRKTENSTKQEMLFKQLNGFREQHRQRKELAKAVSDAGNIVLPIIARPTRQDLENAKDECLRLSVRRNESANAQGKPRVREASGTLMLPELLCNGAVSAGYANYWPDDDGVVRQNHLLVKSGDRVFPTLALAIAQADQGDRNLALESDFRLQLAERKYCHRSRLHQPDSILSERRHPDAVPRGQRRRHSDTRECGRDIYRQYCVARQSERLRRQSVHDAGRRKHADATPRGDHTVKPAAGRLRQATLLARIRRTGHAAGHRYRYLIVRSRN